MADDILLNAPSVIGGKTVATKDVGGVQHEKVINEFLDGGGNPVMVSAIDPMPVTDAAAEAALASIAAEDFATQATLALVLAALNNIDAGTAAALGQALMAASVPVVIASNQTAVPISGTVTVTGAGDATAANQTSQIAQETNINTVLGAVADAIVAAGATGTVSAKLRRATQGLEDLKTLIILAAGANIIGKVGIDQTTPGTTNGVQVNAALPAGNNNIGDVDIASIAAGSNIIGNVRIDQTTPGTTNGVQVNAALPAGNNNIGDVDIASIAAGSNIIGQVSINQTTDGTTNKVRATATQKPSIGATVVMTVTNLQSLASSATAGWQSVRVSNLSTLATDYEIMVKLTAANTAPANDKAMYVFISAAYTSDGGTTWFQSSQGTTTLPTGTEGTTTIASPHNLRLLGVLNYTTAQATVQDTFLLSNCFGNRLPDGFSIIIINFSGAALSTGCIVDYTPINDILV